MNTQNNIVSIVIPVYNLETFIEKCLNSLINQTYKDLEIIIVDDGSTDNTVSIINNYVNKDARFNLYKVNHHGAASARKIGICHASGPYITFVDGDDYLELDAIEVLMNEIIKNDCDIVIAKHRKIFLDNSRAPLQGDYPFKLIDQLSFSNFINSKKDYTLWGKIFKIELFEDIIYHEGIPIGEDALVLNQVILKAQIIKAINQEVYNYVIHENSISQKYYSRISSQLLYIKGSLDNIPIYSNEKQQVEIRRIFRELLEYSKYYLKMTSEEKKLYHSIWVTYYDNKTVSNLIVDNYFLGFKYLLSNKTPRIYSLFQLGVIYFNLFVNRFIVRAKNSLNYYKF